MVLPSRSGLVKDWSHGYWFCSYSLKQTHLFGRGSGTRPSSLQMNPSKAKNSTPVLSPSLGHPFLESEWDMNSLSCFRSQALPPCSASLLSTSNCHRDKSQYIHSTCRLNSHAFKKKKNPKQNNISFPSRNPIHTEMRLFHKKNETHFSSLCNIA